MFTGKSTSIPVNHTSLLYCIIIYHTFRLKRCNYHYINCYLCDLWKKIWKHDIIYFSWCSRSFFVSRKTTLTYCVWKIMIKKLFVVCSRSQVILSKIWSLKAICQQSRGLINKYIRVYYFQLTTVLRLLNPICSFLTSLFNFE